MTNRFTSLILVVVQFAVLGFFFVTGPWLAHGSVWLAVECAGIALGVWAILAMRVGNFNITPDVKTTGQFIGRGPYRWIRHPMYLALLMTTLPLVTSAFTLVRLVVWLIFLVDLLLKIAYEERLLVAHFPAYRSYQVQTSRLLPFIY